MKHAKAVDLGLLVLRVGAGVLLMFHGWGKVSDLLAGQTGFADPLGVGPLPSKILAALAEFVCAGLVVLGVKVRWTAVPPLVTMLVAFLIVHAADPMGDKELALVYAVAFLALVLAGGGRYTLERFWKQRR